MHVALDGEPLCASDKCPAVVAMANASLHSSNIFLHHKDGHRVPVAVRVNPIRNAAGEVTGAVESFADATPVIALLERVRLNSKVLLDPLTGCARMAYVDMTLQTWLNEAQKARLHFGLLLIGIANFSHLKARLGVATADRILAMVGKTLRNCSKVHDLVGYDQDGLFVALIANVGCGGVSMAGQTFCRLVAQSSLSAGSALRVQVCAGGAIAQPSDKAAQILDRARRQLGFAKQAGVSTVKVSENEKVLPPQQTEPA